MKPGDMLGSHRVVSELGAGGMGEVYRARDTKLDRDVALKILPAAVADDPDRLMRFEREAKTLATLNHPNIAHIHGLEESGNIRALVMELVEGEDLSERLARGPIPVAEALPIARQVAEALEAAHEAGIIHRDLKPANIKVRDDGTVKVLDFGLAKALDQGSGTPDRESGSALSAATMTSPAMTQMGMILGTAAYMAPEQARGRAADRRADIWAFGVVLYEMLTGKAPFKGETVPETLGLIFAREPDLSDLGPFVPHGLRVLLGRCLEKDPRRRIRDMGDVRWHLDEVDRGGGEAVADLLPAPSARSAWATWTGVAIVALLAATAGWFARPAAGTGPVRLSIVLPPGHHVTSAPAISPDGTTVAYTAGRSATSARLYLRALDAFDAREVEGTDGAVQPFFSPDSRSVAFFADAKLWRAPVAGGLPTQLAEAAAPWGGAWLPDETLIYAPGLNSGLLRVRATGGTPQQITTPDGAGRGYAHVFPQALPGRSDVLFTLWGQPSAIAVLDVDTGEWSEHPLVTGAVGRYAMSGHLIATDLGGGLFAWPFDPSRPTETPSGALMLEDVYWAMGGDQAWADISTTGTLVFVPGSPTRRHLVWVNRDGQIEPLSESTEPFVATAVSRDGERVAYLAATSLRIQNLRTGAVARLPYASTTSVWPGGWLPDGRLVISTNRDGDWDLFVVDTSGADGWTPLLSRPHAQHPMDVSRTGVIAFLERHPDSGSDLWTVAAGGEARPFAVGPFNQEEARFSPDSQWIAYVSNDSGRKEVYVQPFPGPGTRVQVSVSGGTGPTWSPDGRELYFREDDVIVSVSVTPGRELALGPRKPVLDVAEFESAYFHEFDLSADGERFLMIQSEPDARRTQVNVVVGWFDELRARVSR